jgi:hypothetical protein
MFRQRMHPVAGKEFAQVQDVTQGLRHSHGAVEGHGPPGLPGRHGNAGQQPKNRAFPGPAGPEEHADQTDPALMNNDPPRLAHQLRPPRQAIRSASSRPKARCTLGTHSRR